MWLVLDLLLKFLVVCVEILGLVYVSCVSWIGGFCLRLGVVGGFGVGLLSLSVGWVLYCLDFLSMLCISILRCCGFGVWA